MPLLTTPALAAAALAAGALAVSAPAGGRTASAQPARAASAAPTLTSRVFVDAAHITHLVNGRREAIAGPDDIASLDGRIFVGFQNGVGPQGRASTTGDRDSTIVEFDRSGHVVTSWDVVGKCDGLSADPALGRLVATVNEDAHSSLYVIDPAGGGPVHYRYDVPLPSHGGTDAIDAYRGMILISASAPGTTGASAPRASYPAVYRVVLDPRTRVASIHGLFSDEAEATLANAGAGAGTRARLALTDPDSNETVPAYASRFAGDFMLTSQGDKEQIFVGAAGTSRQTLAVLKLSDSVDDTVWATGAGGAIYVTDNAGDTIDVVTGPMRRGEVFVADTPCDANGAPSACPGPGYPDNFLATLNPDTGAITRVSLRGPAVAAQGMLFAP
ncbi:MAG: hypothetical protein ABSH51_27905 [Solirubrobacteraceae bacterium]|jgi:hypothetical protein